MKMRFVTFCRFLNCRRSSRGAGAALICGLALWAPALAGDGAEQGLSGTAAIAQPAAVKMPLPLKKVPPVLPASLTNVRTAQRNGDLVVSLLTDTPVPQTRQFLLPDPPRLVVDLVNVQNAVTFFDLRIHSLGVKKLRVRQFQSIEPKIVRLVFDLDEGYVKHEVRPENESLEIVFHSGNQADQARVAKNAPADAGPSATAAAEPSPVRAPAPSGHIPEKAAAPEPAPRSPRATEIPRAAVQPAVVDAGTKTPAPKSQTAPRAEPAPATKPAEKMPVVPVVLDPSNINLSGTALIAASEPRALPHPPPASAFTATSRFTGQPLTLDLIDISLVDFFRLMAEEGGINVVMDPEIKGTLSIKVVKVPWDQIFEAALANNGLDKQIDGNLVRIARKATLQEEARQREALKKANLLASDIETRIKRLNYAKAADFVSQLSEQKTVRGTVVVDERTNSLIVTDIPSSLDRMLQLVETLDIPQPQVEIEARIVAATRDFARDIGVQFGFVQGNLQRVTVGGPNTFGTIGGTRPAATPTNTYAAGNESTGRGASQSTSSQSAGVSTGTSDNNSGNFNLNLPAKKAFGGLGISVGNIFDTFLLDAAITAGESKGLAKLISQPKVTAQNNSMASITQGVRFPVQIIANNTVTVQFQNAALTLNVTPQITYEGNIVLDLKVENNTADFANSVNGIPSIRTSESATRVLVTDGGTTVIGGILIDNETTQEDRVPGLASLPVIGNVFKRSMVLHNTQEVLFFITPRVIK